MSASKNRLHVELRTKQKKSQEIVQAGAWSPNQHAWPLPPINKLFLLNTATFKLNFKFGPP